MKRKILSALLAASMVATCLFVPQGAFAETQQTTEEEMIAASSTVKEEQAGNEELESAVLREYEERQPVTEEGFSVKESPANKKNSGQKTVENIRLEQSEESKQPEESEDVEDLEKSEQTEPSEQSDEEIPAEPIEPNEASDENEPLNAVISTGSCGAKVKWSLDDAGVLAISGSGAMYDIEAENDYYLEYKYDIKEVIFENGITAIGSGAFVNCSELTKVTFGNSVKTIGRGAFANCSSLTALNMGSGVTDIGEYAFQGTAIDVFTVPAKVSKMPSTAFFKAKVKAFAVASGNTAYRAVSGVLYKNSGKTLTNYPTGSTAASFTVPSNVTKIDDGAFMHAKNLSSINLSKVISLGESSFQGCGITSLKIPNTVTSAGYFTFYGCEALKSVTFGSGLKETSYEMFEECTALTTINFGKSLQSLDARTFAYCSSLKKVSLPSNIKKIGNGCFGECAALTTFASVSLKEIPFQTFLNCPKLSSVKLNSGIENIYTQSFITCTALKQITIPASVMYIAEETFSTRTKLILKNKNLKKFGNNGYHCVDTVKINGKKDYKQAYKVLALVNQQRAKKGLAKLKMDAKLLNAAMQRSAETAVLFAHTRPDGEDCFSASDLMSAENIACGQTSASSVMDSWMNSPGHKANILSSGSKSIGIGCFVHNGTYYWVQCFGSNSPASFKQPANKTVNAKVNLAPKKFEADGQTYTYKCRLSLKSKKVKSGKSTTAYFHIVNPGWPYVTAKVTSDSVSWSSNKTHIAGVTKKGTVKGVAGGKAKITGKLTYYKASATVTVTGKKAITAFKAGKAKYTVTGLKTVTYKAPTSKNIKKATIPTTVKYKGKTYNVTKISSKAFYNCKKLKTVTINSKKISSIGASAFKNIHKRAVIKTPKGKKTKYQQMIKKSGIASTVKVK